MRIPYYQVNAFTTSVFGGNPAGVCLLDEWLEDRLLLQIAAENDLSETAFLVRGDPNYHLRWFTPRIEMELCGHATLASAFVVFRYVEEEWDRVSFETKSGLLTVERKDDLLMMDFPSWPPTPFAMTQELADSLGREPEAVFRVRDYLAVFPSQADVRNLRPDFKKLEELDCLGIIATAPGDEVDFVSRFFAPRAGIPEDPVTGSAHSTLIPYWSKRLSKTTLHAHQLSQRGGELFCEDRGDRVSIGGHAVIYLEGTIHLD